MDYTGRTGSTGSSSESASKVWDETRQRTEKLIDTGEECVRKNPASAVLIALMGGMFFGALMGWKMAEMQLEHRRHSFGGMFGGLKERFHI